ncbi:uncharacterized protein BYT42DRAFT_588773 [Radiomyces spectabilis]|uniref:uncharacterized protein n=1 Tax=Radiomyces spectabilis TaxID=64574 RepID=UPI002220E99E|nr:uncharacterized protein BYT42DRAFT_588773 [Radiomyces spectabilis]KAI8366063.1 hypothetical protein BYT42DRAFT_588773 [Radiomyces spectabilis]
MAKMAKAEKATKTATKTTKTKTKNKEKGASDDKSNALVRFPKLMPKSSLQVTELEPHQIYLIHDFFTGKECEQLISYFDIHLPLQQVPTIPKPGEAFRSNDRQSFVNEELAQQLWKAGLQQACEHPGITTVSLPRRPAGLNSNLRIYRYRPQQRFECHYDDSVQDKTTGLWTDWTLLIYLNGDMKGGETVFYKSVTKKRKSDPIIVRPERGLALLHRHGQHCLLHEALEVTQGAKWVLRSDVLIG